MPPPQFTAVHCHHPEPALPTHTPISITIAWRSVHHTMADPEPEVIIIDISMVTDSQEENEETIMSYGFLSVETVPDNPSVSPKLPIPQVEVQTAEVKIEFHR